MNPRIIFSALAVLGLLVMLTAWTPGSEKEERHLAISNDPVAPMTAADATKGKALFKKHECHSCHSVTVAGIAKTGEDDPDDEVKPPDLSKAGAKGTSAADMLEYLKKAKKIGGNKHKKKYKGSDEDGLAIASWLATLK